MNTEVQLNRAPSGTQWSIASGDQEAVIVEVGGGLRAYRADGVAVLDGFEEPELCQGSAGQILAPWPNRIRDGRYAFGGPHQLALTEPEANNAIHGLVCWERWSEVRHGVDHVVIEYDLVPQPGYPWPLHFETTWSLGDDGLRADHTVTNLGQDACPFGLASHPYLTVPGVAVDDMTLTVPGNSRLLLDGRCLPIGTAKVAGGEYDFRHGRKIGSLHLDLAFSEFDPGPDGRSVASVVGADGSGAMVWADASFGWWQVYTGDTLPPVRNRRSVALEPMTCPPDAFRSGTDLIVLESGASWSGSWGMRRIAG